MELRIAQSALEDLQAIKTYYTEQDASHIGNEFVSAILTHCEMLLAHPNAGWIVPEFNADQIRELVHPPFRVVYLKQEHEIVLIRTWRSERLLVLPDN